MLNFLTAHSHRRYALTLEALITTRGDRFFVGNQDVRQGLINTGFLTFSLLLPDRQIVRVKL